MTDEELNEKAAEVIDDLTSKFGYAPFILNSVKNGKIKVTCPFCAEEQTFDSLEDMKVYSELPDVDGEMHPVNSCPNCINSRMRSKNDSSYNRYLNLETAKILETVLTEKFNAHIIFTKKSVFMDPHEKVRFRKLDTGDRYEIELHILMAYYNADLFDSIQIDDLDTINAVRIEDGNKINIDNLLVDEKWELFDVSEVPADEETTEEESQEESSEESKEENEIEDVTPEEEPKEEETTEESVETEEKSVEDTTPETVEETKEEEPETEEIVDESPVEVGSLVNEPEIAETSEEDSVESNEEVQKELDEEYEENEITEEDLGATSEDSEPVVEETSVPEETEEAVVESSEEDDDDVVESSEEQQEIDEIENEIKESDIEEAEKEIKEEVKSEESQKPRKLVLDLSGDNDINFNPFGFSSETNVKSNQSVSEDSDKTETKDDRPHLVLDLSGNESQTDGKPEEESVEETSEEKEAENSEEVKEESKEEETKEEPRPVVLDLSGKVPKEDKVEWDKKSKEGQRYKSYKLEDEEDEGNDFIRSESNKVKAEINNKWYNRCIEFDDTDSTFNEFIDEEDLEKEFMESKMGGVIKEVYKRVEDKGIQCSVLINEDTLELPYVDFSSGVRVICIDVDNLNQMSIPVGVAERNVPFKFSLPSNKEKYEKCYLYSDMLTTKDRTTATIRNLAKVVSKERFNPRRIVNLSGNYTLFYTDDRNTIKDFEDKNSSYPYGKPSTKSIAIIALRNKAGQKTEFTQKDLMSWFTKNYQVDLKSFNLFMVASARYIVKPNHKTKTVEYTITDYTELSTAIIKDGLSRIIGAIISEHRMNRTVKDKQNINTDFSTYQYQFEFEFDPASLPSPSLEIWYDNSGFIPSFTSRFEDGQGRCYIRKVENRTSLMDSYRIDSRYFLPATFARKFSAEIAKANVNILHTPSRLKLIERLGFVDCYYPRTKKFMLNPIEVIKAYTDPSTLMMQKMDIASFFSGSGVYDGGYDNLLMQKFLLSKFNNSDMDTNTKSIMTFLMMSNFAQKIN